VLSMAPLDRRAARQQSNARATLMSQCRYVEDGSSRRALRGASSQQNEREFAEMNESKSSALRASMRYALSEIQGNRTV